MRRLAGIALLVVLLLPAVSVGAADDGVRAAPLPSNVDVTWTLKPWVRCQVIGGQRRADILVVAIQCKATKKLKRGRSKQARMEASAIGEYGGVVDLCSQRRRLNAGGTVNLRCGLNMSLVSPPPPPKPPVQTWRFAGTGNSATDAISLVAGQYRVEYQCAGPDVPDRRLYVLVHYESVNISDYLVVTECPSDGERVHNVLEGLQGRVAFEVRAPYDEQWSFTITPIFPTNRASRP